MAGEILPIHFEGGEKLYALNVLECINMLNKEDTVYDIYDDGSKGRILKYSFHENRISESSIFKIPETSRSEILTYSGIQASEDEFFNLYKKLNFTGLIFKRDLQMLAPNWAQVCSDSPERECTCAYPVTALSVSPL